MLPWSALNEAVTGVDVAAPSVARRVLFVITDQTTVVRAVETVSLEAASERLLVSGSAPEARDDRRIRWKFGHVRPVQLRIASAVAYQVLLSIVVLPAGNHSAD